MRRGVLIRNDANEQGTLGWLILDSGFWLRTLELPWEENRVNRSCIPSGKYHTKFLPRSGTGRYKKVWHVNDVPNRSGILIHAGNFAGNVDLGYRTNVRGCILVGKRVGRIGGQRAVINSRVALASLREELRAEDFSLTIIDNT